MEILLKSALALPVQLFLFLCVGTVIIRLLKTERFSPGSAMLLGYFAFFSVFEAAALIFELNLFSFKSFAICMTLLCAAALLSAVIFGHGLWKSSLDSLPERIRSHGFFIILPLLVTIVCVLIAVLYTDASADSDYYVGMASTALFTDTLGRFEPTSGDALTVFKARYAFACYPYYNALSAYIFRLPVIVQARSVSASVNVIMANLAAYCLGRSLFRGRERSEGKVRSIGRRASSVSRRRADVFVAAVFLVNVFSSSIYLPGTFLFSRSYEGKSLIVNICLPCVLALCVRFIHDSRQGSLDGLRHYDGPAEGSSFNLQLFLTLFLISAAGVCFSASSLFILLLALFGLLPAILIQKKKRLLLPFAISISPIAAWAVVYYMTQHGMILLRAVK